MPVVGITSYTPCGGEAKAYSLPCEYVDALIAGGTQPFLLAAGGVGECLDRLDGLVVSGGGDLDPATYGGCRHPTTYMVDRRRDEFEIALVRESLARRMPLLAICRGMQVLNVALGGSLIEHVPERFGDTVAHRLPPREPVPHEVVVDPSAALATILGAGAIQVVSWHHQAVDRIAPGLRPVVRAADGLVEAVELAVDHFVAAVQWHPELSAATDARQAALFTAFSSAARIYASKRRNGQCV